MIKYMIVHCKHNGCYDFQHYEDESGKKLKPIVTINPPKIFLFDNKSQAKEFFDEYINDVDTLDERCVNGENINHVDYCTCGIVELDEEDGQPIFFYNKKNQIFLLETGPQLFVTPHNLKINLNNMNLTNSLIRKSKFLGREQKLRYVELGKKCQDILKYQNNNYMDDSDSDDNNNNDNSINDNNYDNSIDNNICKDCSGNET